MNEKIAQLRAYNQALRLQFYRIENVWL